MILKIDFVSYYHLPQMVSFLEQVTILHNDIATFIPDSATIYYVFDFNFVG